MRMSRPTWLTVLLCVALAATAVEAATVVDLAETEVPHILGAAMGDRLGYAVAGGDMDGDGDDELVVSAPGSDISGTDAGAVYIFEAEVLGSDGPASPGDAATTFTGSHPLERFGETLCVADVNGDGQADLLIGSPGWGPGERMLSGRVYVLLGPIAPGGPATGFSQADAVVDGVRAGDRLGSSIVVTDVLGEAGAEVIVSACRASDAANVRTGSVYIIEATLLASGPRDEPVASVSSAELRGEAEGDALCSVAVARRGPSSPTLVALGAYQADGNSNAIDAGKVYLVRGDWIASLPLHESMEIDAPVIVGPHPRSFFGGALAAGDMDGDGLDDIAASAYASRAHRKKADASGEVFLMFGSASPPPRVLDLSGADVPRFVSESRWDLFGLPLMFTDTNGDGRDDLVVSAQFADADDARRRCGTVYVFRGGPRSVIEVKMGKAELADVIVIGAQAFDKIGSSLAAVRLTGERPDLVIGAPDAGENELDPHAGEPSAGMVLVVPEGLVRGY